MSSEAAKLKKFNGCDIRVVKCDAAEHIDTRHMVGAILLSCKPRLGGVWHAAGVLSDGLLHSQNFQSFKRVYAPKAYGAWALHEMLTTSPLHACVLFSSVAALLGGAGQSNYSAANCCLDATSSLRRSVGLAASSIQWGPWADVGMAAEGSINARMQASGIGLITLADGANAFVSAMSPGGPVVQTMVLMKWGLSLIHI